MKKRQQIYTKNKTHTQPDRKKKKEREKQSIVITKQRLLLIKSS
jgi:hypothetical protein